MFKKSRIKIVAAIMTILVLLWVGTLGVIYTSSYIDMKNQNESMLRAHAERYVLAQSFENITPPNRPRPEEMPNFNNDFDPESPRFQLSTFYTVAVAYSGDIIEIKNEPPTIYTNNDLENLAKDIIKSDKTKGIINNLAFYKLDKGGYLLVTFMDNTVVNESAWTLFRYTLIFGAAVIVLFFFLSVFLARKIVNPLEKSYQKQKQFISDASHELKTPISVVSANAELLSREIGDNQWLANIQYENKRMALLVGQLLDIARTESVTPQTEQIDFSRLVAGEVLPFESVAFEKGLVLSSDIGDSISVEGNSAQLKQLVSILLDNAIRHSADNGKVRIALIKKHSKASLTVINKGEEIPANQREHLFERFYRVDTARNGQDKHYGLGLAIAKAITGTHKGEISVKCYNGLIEFCVEIPVL